MNLSTTLLACGICPPATELSDIPATVCGKGMGQIQRYLLLAAGKVIWDSGTPANNVPVTIVNDLIEDKTGWDVLKTATDLTKVIRTPLIGGDSGITAGTELTEGGGDNSTLNGATLSNGTNPADGIARFDNLDKDQIKAFREIYCYFKAVGSGSVEMYMISQDNTLWARKSGVLITGFPLQKFYLGAKGNAGLNSRDSNEMTFQLEADYDEYLTPIAVNFNILSPAVY
jgi:hypothetical protein